MAIINIHRYYLVVIAIFWILVTAHADARADQDVYHVLILNSYHKGYEWSDRLVDGIELALRQTARETQIQVEYMDAKRIHDNGYLEKLYRLYLYKFAQRRFDVIITTDDDAYQFVLQRRTKLFAGVPLVFCGVNNFHREQLAGQKLITGIIEDVPIEDTLRIALHLHPSASQVIAIIDTTTTGMIAQKKLQQLKQKFRHPFTLWQARNIEDLIVQVRQAPANSIIILLALLKDDSGDMASIKTAMSRLAQNSKAPIYGVWDFYLRSGLVGGKILCSYNIGLQTGNLARRILEGESITNIPVSTGNPGNFFFDFVQIERFTIPKSSLPPGSIIVNAPDSFYTVNKTWIWSTLGVLLFLTLTIVMLLANIYKRRRAEQDLLQERSNMETAWRQEKLLAQAEKRNTEAIQTIEQSMRLASIGVMAAGITHEINQPLNAIKVTADSVLFWEKRQPGTVPAQLIHKLQKISEGAQRIDQIIKHMRSFWIESGNHQQESVDVNQAVRNAMSLINRRLHSHGITPELGLTDANEPVGANHLQIEQIVINLAVNSMHALDQVPCCDKSITVNTANEPEYMVLTVSDNGTGLPEGIGDKLYNPFYSTKNPGQGMGLGLAIVKKVVDRYQGRIKATNNPDGGARFVVHLLKLKQGDRIADPASR